MNKTKAVSNSASKNSTLFTKIENRILEKRKQLFYFLILLGVFFSLINFNARISEAHDDSLYIEAGYKYVHEFPNYYYTSNAPMYPMFLALLTLIFGTNLIVFKLFSMLLFVAGTVIYFKAIEKFVPTILSYFALVFLCCNHLIIYFSSQTFSEPFYMLIQAIFFYYFLKYNFGDQAFKNNLKEDYKKWLVLGLLMMMLTVAKNILVFGIAAVFLFYLLRKDYKKAFFSMLAFGIFKLLFEFIKNLVWGASAIQYKSQMGILLNKDPYDASKGQEDVAGFIGRFVDNIGLYLGKRFYQILGFLDEDFMMKRAVEINGETVEETKGFVYLLIFIVLFLVFYGLYRAIKEKQFSIMFLLLFALVISFGTFFVLQARWDQPRFIMVHMPTLLIGIGFGGFKYFEKHKSIQFVFVGIILLVVMSLFASTLKRGLKNIPVVTKNLKGDIYFGYTPDWRNYLEASAWCKDNLPDTALVACRKAPMSFVYAKGKHFFPIYSVVCKDTATQQSQPDSALAYFRKNKVTHILLASLRMNPKANTGDVINTVHNILIPIFKKYPQKIKEIKTFGGDEEPSAIYEIKY